MKEHSASPQKQTGITLVVGLIMLIIMSLLAIAVYHMSSSQTLVVSNAQHTNEAKDAAQAAIETVINSGAFAASTSTAPTVVNVDMTGSGNSPIKVTVAKPICLETVPIPAATVNAAYLSDIKANNTVDSAWAGCLQNPPGSGSSGVSGVNVGLSTCDNSIWDVTAEAQDAATGTDVTISQGVGVLISQDQSSTSCPTP
ncbi:pilus assembly PilX N-terminal domain-containing protein [Rhodoferax sp. GW822-FHT02A01]|uniref:pilus assembly PilX family protein n=1 Tax=Rhodoferax sp. GW822-FHT02A01 TaxID=3141537 RepID=UPI00315C4F7C